MKTQDVIKHYERLWHMSRNMQELSKDSGLYEISQGLQEEIDYYKKTIEHLKQVQLEEAKSSAGNSWRDDIWMYSTVTFGIGFILLLFDKILSII